jgi:hypothetical protein
MKKALVLDLAWTTTGWVVWDVDGDALLEWGQFTARNKTGNPADDSAHYIAHIATQIWASVNDLAEEFQVSTIVYEYTDWHRSSVLDCRKNYSNRAKEYKIERGTQRALGRAEVLLAVLGSIGGYEVVGYGANEVKRGLEFKSKAHAAMIAASAYQELFRYLDGAKGKYLQVAGTGEMLSHHISDAITIAMYHTSQARFKEAMGR